MAKILITTGDGEVIETQGKMTFETIKKEDEHNYLFITKYKDILMYGKAKIINDLFMSVCTYNENFEIIYY